MTFDPTKKDAFWVFQLEKHHGSTSIVSQGDLNTRVDAAREQVDAWLAAKLGDLMQYPSLPSVKWCQF